ncbi:MAG: thioredoxin domain-containing protein [Proteobacteria bacterium]|nr:thioredoxin domain-containing protein [Pseudomonadota bacterium]
MKILTFLAIAAVMALASCSVQSGVSGLDPAQGDQILSELRQIHQLLLDQGAHVATAPQAQAPAPVAAPMTAPAPAAHAAATTPLVSLDASPHDSIGSSTAAVVLVEFTDYQCPFCRRFHERSWPEIKRRYVDTGKVRLEVRDMPLQFHDAAMPAAIAARCAGQQGKFWPVFSALLDKPDALTKEGPRQAAIAAGVSLAAFEQCLRNPQVLGAIEADIEDAQRIGVDGTPGFVIARRKGNRLEGTLLLGAQPANVFASRIDALLDGPTP